MSVASAQAVTVTFTTQGTDGVSVDADSAPTATLYVNGVANGAAVTVTNVTTGLYKAAVTMPTLAANAVAEIVVAATVGGTAGKGLVWRDLADTGTLADAVWDEATSGHGTAGTYGVLPATIRAQFAGDLPALIIGYANGVIGIVRGDSYNATTRTLTVTEPSGANWPALDGTWTVKFNARLRDTTGATGTTTIADKTCVIVDADTVRIDLLATDTAGLDLGPPTGTGRSGAGAWDWELEASKSSDRFTLISGSMTVLKDLKTT